MRALFHAVVLLVLCSCCVSGCATLDELAPPVLPGMVAGGDAAGDGLSELMRGRDIYVTACARCHSPERVTRYSSAEWREILPRMAEEASLDAAERGAVEAYVHAVLAAHRDG